MSDVSRPTISAESPYLEFSRVQWARLRDQHPMSLGLDDVRRLRGAGERIDLAEVEEVYLPLSRLLNFYVGATAGLHRVTSDFLGERPEKTPFIIGVAGSVAVGKSTTARILRELLARWEGTPRVELITTDGFLFPNAELQRRGILNRKGFPESYDRRSLVRFVAEVKSGKHEVSAPVYSHLTYDIVEGERVVVRQPDVLIVEGLNVLQPSQAIAGRRNTLNVSDYFDFSVYVDARESDIRRWYVDRFLGLRQTAFADPDSYFHRYASLTDEQAVDRANQIWEEINLPNLVENVAPTRSRATLVLSKGGDHGVSRVSLRKL
ncbi:type I pantothenate kinase [Yimella sp. NH-Cas1]|uniref:type I pantothenate kinase n=1 Tax=Yimella sp. NH-Cas1 TaxID=2917726 RepID=UPI001EFBA593|nr:type I pantothenate kinase [Yimella sp. NH-Cas1]MCG8654497.1 type I pantothenate kinase [Yimella sp. NH-Cas1]